MRTPEQHAEIASALAAWQEESELLAEHARQLRRAMVAYADGTATAPIAQIEALELRRGRADELARDLLDLIEKHSRQHRERQWGH